MPMAWHLMVLRYLRVGPCVVAIGNMLDALDAKGRADRRLLRLIRPDMLTAVARKDYDDRRRRQAQAKAKAEGRYKGTA